MQGLSVRSSRQKDRLLLSLIGYAMLGVMAFICVVPFVIVLSSSLTDENTIRMNGFGLIPKVFSAEAYRMIFEYPDDIVRAYGVTLVVTAIGTALGLFLTAMTAYVLCRKDFKWRNHFAFYFFFTTLFSGGLVPWYLLIVNYLDMKNTLAALIIPTLVNVFYIMVMRAFLAGIPDAISESAKIDGAGDFRIFLSLILPLSKPALATVGLFLALGHWNDWYSALLFISDDKLMPLQYYLYQMLGNLEGMRKAMLSSGTDISANIPGESLKMAMTVVACGPILFAYPFIQKYFVQGLTIGAVKG
ncbi:carbohydrate ABC transporter permease [Paenibacillus sacheonensis]|uniref:ABC transporter permease subunit n=1 Tax=Paenibacillus sacheonensis TaxID=742054 RepID=A0A7X4YJT6_9BACL|nr:carbohydrate ABC transporter permease [Paenibacillus sacheonensis]MBM7564065.1 putative aldouronate transport system permease protein [Paenibacillus sacheonensis]NBC67603.1 ABC transporter permease subunit [Paenibacillus sacheonensis]